MNKDTEILLDITEIPFGIEGHKSSGTSPSSGFLFSVTIHNIKDFTKNGDYWTKVEFARGVRQKVRMRGLE